MGEVSGVPEHDVVVLNGGAIVDELVEVSHGSGWVSGESLAVIYFGVAVLHGPQVTDPKAIGDPVIRARSEGIALAGVDIFDKPFALVGTISQTARLKPQCLPVLRARHGRMVEFPYTVVVCSADIEIEPPVGMMMVNVAHTRVPYRGEAETGTDGAVIVEAPLADVAIPARFHFAYEHRFLAFSVERNTEEVPGVLPGLKGWSAPGSLIDESRALRRCR